MQSKDNFWIWVKKLRELSSKLDKKINIMTLCGTHENTVAKYGIRSLLPSNISLVPGPGCPVCVLPDEELQKAMYLLQNADVVLTTFGDMARVPYNGISLFMMRSMGYDVRVVYSIFDAIALADKVDKPVVHLAIGFETTMPSTALALMDKPDNFYVLCSHRFFVPAIEHLLEDRDIKVDGFINPGHVSAIVGSKAYESFSKNYGIPQVISGFEAEDVVESIYLLLGMIMNNERGVVNQYKRVVSEHGNVEAQKVMRKTFVSSDALWRGLGMVRNTGVKIKSLYKKWDAEHEFKDLLADFVPEEDIKKRACRCGDVLKGLCTPKDCKLFMKTCTPRNPVGACMVSIEGACNIWASFGESSGKGGK